MGVFLALTFEDEIYKDYPAVCETIRNHKFQNLLITLREDGHFGFLGGSVDDSETELQALVRESKEEGNIDLPWLLSCVSADSFNRVCEHTLNDGYKVILYHLKITKQLAKNIIRNSVEAPHFFTETAGIVSVAIHNKSRFYQNTFLSCMNDEFREIGKLIESNILQTWGNLIE
jgi:hypothetical protein